MLDFEQTVALCEVSRRLYVTSEPESIHEESDRGFFLKFYTIDGQKLELVDVTQEMACYVFTDQLVLKGLVKQISGFEVEELETDQEENFNFVEWFGWISFDQAEGHLYLPDFITDGSFWETNYWPPIAWAAGEKLLGPGRGSEMTVTKL
jgi:hypothetical protein